MRRWVMHNKETFERDVLRDFCRASTVLAEQFTRFSQTGMLSFPVMRDLVGGSMNKGLLWRLKDNAHHIFCEADKESTTAMLLDRALGYIFHESLKLMEDAHQGQFYAPQLSLLAEKSYSAEVQGILSELIDITEQTRESMRREVARLETLLRLSRRLFVVYFSDRVKHRPLARFLHDREVSVRQAFMMDYSSLMKSIYGIALERLHIEAAYSLMESARHEDAAVAVDRALKINPKSAEALDLQRFFAKS